MNIEGMGESLVNQLADKRLVTNVADIFELTEEKLLSLDRMGKKSAQNADFVVGVAACVNALTTLTLTGGLKPLVRAAARFELVFS